MNESYSPANDWIVATLRTIDGYRDMIDASVSQLSDTQFFARPADGFNSVAVVLRHLGGNLQSRWTNFLIEDGEKPSRDRDTEFQDWESDRQSLMEYFEDGWSRLIQTVGALSTEDLNRTVLIRGESQSVPFAIQRSLTHISYHTGQIMLIARLMHGHDDWNWISIEPNRSQEFNSKTWGTPASRGIAGDAGDAGEEE